MSRGYKASKSKCPPSKLFTFLHPLQLPARPAAAPRQRSVGIVEGDMEAPYRRFRFTERKIADCPPRPQLPNSADEHRASEIAELQDTLE
jgi:hypothetical protein